MRSLLRPLTASARAGGLLLLSARGTQTDARAVGSHNKQARQALAALFDHRGARNLEWRKVAALMRSLGGSIVPTRAPSRPPTAGTLSPSERSWLLRPEAYPSRFVRLQIGGVSRVFRTSSGARHERKTIGSQHDVAALRRLLVRSGAVNDGGEPTLKHVATTPSERQCVVVVSHKNARVFTKLESSPQPVLVPVPEPLGHDADTHHLHPKQQPPGGELAAPKGGNYYGGVTSRRFVDEVRGALPSAGADVLVIGHGKGHSSAAQQLAEVLGTAPKRAGTLHKKGWGHKASADVEVVGVLKCDTHLHDKQLIATAKRWFDENRP